MEEQHGEEPTELMLSNVVALSLIVRLGFKIIAKEIKILIVGVSRDLRQSNITMDGRAAKESLQFLDESKALKYFLHPDQVLDHVYRDGLDGACLGLARAK